MRYDLYHAQSLRRIAFGSCPFNSHINVAERKLRLTILRSRLNESNRTNITKVAIWVP